MNAHSPAMQAELALYNASMERSLEDKLFFLEQTAGAMTFVDFGCANGAVLKAISERRGDHKTLVGVDINPMQLAIAGQKVPEGVFVEDFELVRDLIAAAPGPKVAIFSSVLHESVEIFKEPMLSGLFDFIVIRDMGVSTAAESIKVPDAWVEAIVRETPSKVLDAWPKSGNRPFDQSIADLTEFLLKVPYLGYSETQTERELAENYPVRDIYELLEIGPTAATPYAVTSFEHYSAPWLVDRVLQDYGFEFPYPTHFKMILKKVAR